MLGGSDTAALAIDDRVQRGRDARADASRSSHAEFSPGPDRPDPVNVLDEQARTRVPELVPIRYGRMLQSPFAFTAAFRVAWSRAATG